MSENNSDTSLRKKEHLELCASGDVGFRQKTAGFEQYDFLHYAATETMLSAVSFKTDFFGTEIDYPFLISCMTGGVEEADNINLKLASAARALNIPLGLGSLRYALGTPAYDAHFSAIRDAAGGVPLLANIGAAQVLQQGTLQEMARLIEVLGAKALYVHVNPSQELLQQGGEPAFTGLKLMLSHWVKELPVPILVKEVGAGIAAPAAAALLDAGVAGIDVAGAGGTSWQAVEILRNKDGRNQEFWDWGLPAAYCIRTVAPLKNGRPFMLIGSGGINDFFSGAKALALGADLIASARMVLRQLEAEGTPGVVAMVHEWFDGIRKIIFLTGARSLAEFNASRLILVKDLY